MKYIFAAAAVLAAVFICGICCGAQESGDIIDTKELYDALELPDDELEEAVPEEARRIFSENNITIDDTGSFSEMSFEDVLGYIGERFRAELAFPVRVLGLMTAAALLSAAAGSLSDGFQGNSGKIYRAAAVLVTVTVIAAPASECIESVADTVRAGGNFMLAYVPVYAGIAASSGNLTGSAVYNMAVIAVADGAVQLTSRVFMPLMSICMAMGIIDGINSGFSLNAVTSLIHKLVTLGLGIIMTVFTGMLSLQSALGTAADSFGIKAAKLAVSNLVPVVGGALSDSYTAVRSGLSLLKGAAGIYGIAAVALTILPPLIKSASLYIALGIGTAFSEILGQSDLAKLLKNTASVIGMAVGMLLCFGAMLIISTGILMKANAG